MTTWQEVAIGIVVAFIVIQLLTSISQILNALFMLVFAGIMWIALTPAVWIERWNRGKQ